MSKNTAPTTRRKRRAPMAALLFLLISLLSAPPVDATAALLGQMGTFTFVLEGLLVYKDYTTSPPTITVKSAADVEAVAGIEDYLKTTFGTDDICGNPLASNVFGFNFADCSSLISLMGSDYFVKQVSIDDGGQTTFSGPAVTMAKVTIEIQTDKAFVDAFDAWDQGQGATAGSGKAANFEFLFNSGSVELYNDVATDMFDLLDPSAVWDFEVSTITFSGVLNLYPSPPPPPPPPPPPLAPAGDDSVYIGVPIGVGAGVLLAVAVVYWKLFQKRTVATHGDEDDATCCSVSYSNVK